jgi:putative lipoprotein (rSAM/lipoprotein system)
MKQIALKGRLVLRKILTGLSMGLVALVFQACYGSPPAYRGAVKNADTGEPISGIKVSAGEYDGYYDITDNKGRFLLYGSYDITSQDITLQFKDVDGFKNGEFQDKTITLDLKNTEPLTIALNHK